MKFEFSRHAQIEMTRRLIPECLVNRIVQAPEQVVEEHGNVVCYQSITHEAGRPYLIRVMVNPTVEPAQIVTVYRTSKIGKYWRTT